MIDYTHEGAVVEISVEKNGYDGNLLLKRESGRIQVVPISYADMELLKDQLTELIPQIQDEMAADLAAENEALNEAEQRAIQQRETELEMRYNSFYGDER